MFVCRVCTAACPLWLLSVVVWDGRSAGSNGRFCCRGGRSCGWGGQWSGRFVSAAGRCLFFKQIPFCLARGLFEKPLSVARCILRYHRYQGKHCSRGRCRRRQNFLPPTPEHWRTGRGAAWRRRRGLMRARRAPSCTICSLAGSVERCGRRGLVDDTRTQLRARRDYNFVGGERGRKGRSIEIRRK